MAPAPLAPPPPPLNIPDSESTVQVHIINTTTRIRGIAPSLFLEPEMKGFGPEVWDLPAYSFLIQHAGSGHKLLFDLGARADWENLAPTVVDRIKGRKWHVEVEKGVADILEEGGVGRADINGIIWSHHHWDHIGDPSTFPPSTDLIVGPGFGKAVTPGYPTNPDSPIRDSDLAGRTLREISFADSRLSLGRFRALDWFGDGSFYLLDSAGHTMDHLCALCRVTAEPPTFIFLGGDCVHHGGEFRPTAYLPLPQTISPSPLPHLHANICLGSIFTPIHRLHDSHVDAQEDPALAHPFFTAAEGMAANTISAQESIEKMEDFDAHDNIFIVFAHDQSLLDVVCLFPETRANDWKEKGWKKKGLWRFLGDFNVAVGGGRNGQNSETLHLLEIPSVQTLYD